MSRPTSVKGRLHRVVCAGSHVERTAIKLGYTSARRYGSRTTEDRLPVVLLLLSILRRPSRGNRRRAKTAASPASSDVQLKNAVHTYTTRPASARACVCGGEIIREKKRTGIHYDADRGAPPVVSSSRPSAAEEGKPRIRHRNRLRENAIVSFPRPAVLACRPVRRPVFARTRAPRTAAASESKPNESRFSPTATVHFRPFLAPRRGRRRVE